MKELKIKQKFTQTLKVQIISKKKLLQKKETLLRGYFLNNYLPTYDENGICLIISNVYTEVLEFIKKTINSLNFNLSFKSDLSNEKLGKTTHYLKIYGDDLEKFEKEIGLNNELLIDDKIFDMQAFVCGMFLASGSMNEPSNRYHFEIRCATIELADYLKEIYKKFNIYSLFTYHKNKPIVYLKKRSSVSDALKLMYCDEIVLKIEADNVDKIWNQNVSRTTRLEIANLAKTVSASSVQIKQIMVIENSPYWSKFNKYEQKCFQLRKEHEEYSLLELSKEVSIFFNVDISRSSIQNYFKKLNKLYNDFI